MAETRLSKAQFREMWERCGISQKMLADHFGVKVLTVKRWEKPGESEPPADAQAWLTSMLSAHVKTVEDAVGAVDSMIDQPDHVDLRYYRSQAHYDKFGRGNGDFALVNARAREIGMRLESEGIEARFFYPEDNAR